jgi:hypothetical protein
MYGSIEDVQLTKRTRAAPMIALMGLAVMAVIAVATLTAHSQAVEMVSFPQDDLGILKEMVLNPRPSLPFPLHSCCAEALALIMDRDSVPNNLLQYPGQLCAID